MVRRRRLDPRRVAQSRVLALAFAAMFASAPGQSFLIAVFLDAMLRDTGVSRSAVAALYAGATVVSASAVSVLGPAADRFGLRAIWAVVSLGLAVACGLASVATGIVTVLLALSLLRAFGQGSFPLVGTLLVARSFSRRGQAMAIAAFGLTAASVVLPPVTVALLLELGWRSAFRVLGLAVLVLVLPLALLVRESRPARHGDSLASGPRGPRALRASRRLPRLSVPTTRARRLLVVLAAPPLLMTAVVFHAVALLEERGLSLGEAGFALSVFGAMSGAGTLVGGAIADRVTSRTLLSAMAALLAAGMLVLLVPTAATSFLGLALLGLAGGLFGVAGGVVWPRTYGLTEIGRLQGTSFSVQIAAAAAGPLPLALSEAATGSFAPALAALGASGLLALAVAARWREPRLVRMGERRRRTSGEPR